MLALSWLFLSSLTQGYTAAPYQSWALGPWDTGSQAPQGEATDVGVYSTALPVLLYGYFGKEDQAYKLMLYSSGHIMDGHCFNSYWLGGDKAVPTTVTHHFCSSLLSCHRTEELHNMQNWCFLSETWAQVFLQMTKSDTVPVQYVWFSILGLSFFQPAQRRETCSLVCSLLLPQTDPLQDNEQWLTWSPQLHNLNWNGSVRHPQVLRCFSRAVSASHGWTAAVPTDSGFQTGFLFLDKQVSFFRKGKSSFVQEVSFWREEETWTCAAQGSHQEPNMCSWSGSIGPTRLRKCSWVISKISVFWFCWLSALLFLISSFVRRGKSIVLLSRYYPI